jgi:hypothetical protein
MEKLKHLMGRAWRAPLVAATAVVALVATAGPAGATTTYDIAPVTTSLTGELAANVPVILTAVGALIALAIAVRMVRKFVKA